MRRAGTPTGTHTGTPTGTFVRTLPWLVGLAALALVGVLRLRAGRGTWELVVRAPVWLACAEACVVLLVLAALTVTASAWVTGAQQRARAEAWQVSRTRHQQFIQRLDHELRNPLTAIRTVVADRASLAVGSEREALQVADAQSRRMSRLLTDLRKLAELETAPLSLEQVDLAETIREAVDATVEKTAGAGGVAPVRVDLPQAPWPLPCVRGDADLLYCAVVNLIDNAVKYTPPSGLVEVRGSEGEGVVSIEVADTGVGVPDAELGTVLGELARGSNVRGLPGSGLGLPLVSTIVRRHGGQLQLSSREGVGTRAWIRLPLEGPGPQVSHDCDTGATAVRHRLRSVRSRRPGPGGPDAVVSG